MSIAEAITSLARSANRMLSVIQIHTRVLGDQGSKVTALEKRVETLEKEVFTAVARPLLCHREGNPGYHWGSIESTKIRWPYTMAGLGELHEATIARVLRGEVAVPAFCAQCREHAARQGCG